MGDSVGSTLRAGCCLLAMVPVALSTGCATTATVTVQNGIVYEARISGGDAQHLLLTSEYGVNRVVRRAEVRDIDHPGNVVAVAGGILAGIAALNMVTVATSCGSSQQGAPCIPLLSIGGIMLAGGGTMLTWGLWTWTGSRGMVADTITAAPLAEPPADTAPPGVLLPGPPPPALLPSSPL
ncbi:MAG: hypothetical protein INH41_20685 [Myxococcaceae bacterium]|nr:hypothetical protein [Myxococcaceae bacterium]MCA3014808.1 hypothetical protein [Myxococcaceae bacterium]